MQTDVIESTIVVAKNKFQCTFSLVVLPNKKVSLKKSKVVCSPRKPKRKKASNVQLIGELGTYFVSLTINPSKIKSAVFVEAQKCNYPTTKEYECPTPKECRCPSANKSTNTTECHCPTQYECPTTGENELPTTIPESTESEFDEGPPLLFLGAGGQRVSEIFSLPVLGQGDEQILNPTKTSCFVESSPHLSHQGSVAFVHNGIFVECGGCCNVGINPEKVSPYLRECYSMINFEWIATTPMLTKRSGAASVVLDNGSVLVSGGQKDIFGGLLATTESYDGTRWTRGTNLPHGASDHCMLVLPGGDLLMVGGFLGGLGVGYSVDSSSTFIYSNNTGVWTEKDRMSTPRVWHACALYNGEVWVGGSGAESSNFVSSVEIFSPSENRWRPGPNLPTITYFPGKFVSHGQALLYAGGLDAVLDAVHGYGGGGGGSSDGYGGGGVGGYGEGSDGRVRGGGGGSDDIGKQVHQLNKGKDGWTFIMNMAEARYLFPVLVISEAECNGVSYSSDLKTGVVSGSILDVFNNLTRTSVEVEIKCCTQGVVSTTKICGNGVSCETICGEHNKEFAILSLTPDVSDAEVCPLVYKKHFVITTTIYQLNYCPRRVLNVRQLTSYKQCCLHPAVYKKPDIKEKCCSYGLCV